jgi:hypothetical protein
MIFSELFLDSLCSYSLCPRKLLGSVQCCVYYTKCVKIVPKVTAQRGSALVMLGVD